mgnify:CR=1 FL=1
MDKKNTPEVKLGQYKGLAVTRHVRPVTDKTVDIELVHQTRMHAVYHPTTEPAKRGFRALLDFAGYMDGKEIPDSRMEKVMVVLGDGKLMPAAEDAIYGHTAGETFRFDFTYPEQFRVEELSGKTAQFEIKLHSVAEKTTPELNEEFARAQGYADLAAMREAVRAKKRKIHEDAADRAMGGRNRQARGRTGQHRGRRRQRRAKGAHRVQPGDRGADHAHQPVARRHQVLCPARCLGDQVQPGLQCAAGWGGVGHLVGVVKLCGGQAGMDGRARWHLRCLNRWAGL